MEVVIDIFIATVLPNANDDHVEVRPKGYASVIAVPEEGRGKTKKQRFHKDSTSCDVYNVILALENGYAIDFIGLGVIRRQSLRKGQCIFFKDLWHRGLWHLAMRMSIRIEVPKRGEGSEEVDISFRFVYIIALILLCLLYSLTGLDKPLLKCRATNRSTSGMGKNICSLIIVGHLFQ